MKFLPIVILLISSYFVAKINAAPQQPTVPWPQLPNINFGQPSTPDQTRPQTTTTPSQPGWLDMVSNMWNQFWSAIPNLIGLFRPPPNNNNGGGTNPQTVRPANQLPPFPASPGSPVPQVPAQFPLPPQPFPFQSNQQPQSSTNVPATATATAATNTQPNLFQQWTSGFQQPTPNAQSNLPNQVVTGGGQSNNIAAVAASGQRPAENLSSALNPNNQNHFLNQLTKFNRPNQPQVVQPTLSPAPPTNTRSPSNTSTGKPPQNNRNPNASGNLMPIEDD